MSNINWIDPLYSGFCREVIEYLGHWRYQIPDDHNIICKALADDGDQFFADISEFRGFSLLSLTKLAVACQMMVYDASNGPDGDGKPKALRRHWYHWYKVDFAQPLSNARGENTQETSWGTRWSGRQSEVYAWFIDERIATYKDMWVRDASRMISGFDEELFAGANIILAVEKDSLFEDFSRPAQALGCKAIISGKGKNSKAAVEKMLRDHFRLGEPVWSSDHMDYVELNPFEDGQPLHVIHISDFDYDGEKVIGATFGKHLWRYAEDVNEARVGINPAHVINAGYNLSEKIYQVKLTNKGYKEWATAKAIWIVTCSECGKRSLSLGLHPNDDSPCCDALLETIDINKDPAWGLEVEAMRTADYNPLIVNALLHIMEFDHIINKLRDECVADASTAAYNVRIRIARKNKTYQKLEKEMARLEAIKIEYDEQVENYFYDAGGDHIHDWRDDDEDPTVDDLKQHVEQHSEVWRPFDTINRTRKLINFLIEDEPEAVEEFEEKVVEW